MRHIVISTFMRRFRSALSAAFVGAVAGAIAVCLILSAAAQAQLAPREARPGQLRAEPARPPASPLRPQFPRTVTPPFPTEPAAGLCQCISDRTRRNISCLAGPAACQSVCGTTNYSLVPDAAFPCPLAPGEQFAREPVTRREQLTQ